MFPLIFLLQINPPPPGGDTPPPADPAPQPEEETVSFKRSEWDAYQARLYNAEIESQKNATKARTFEQLYQQQLNSGADPADAAANAQAAMDGRPADDFASVQDLQASEDRIADKVASKFSETLTGIQRGYQAQQLIAKATEQAKDYYKNHFEIFDKNPNNQNVVIDRAVNVFIELLRLQWPVEAAYEQAMLGYGQRKSLGALPAPKMPGTGQPDVSSQVTGSGNNRDAAIASQEQKVKQAKDDFLKLGNPGNPEDPHWIKYMDEYNAIENMRKAKV